MTSQWNLLEGYGRPLMVRGDFGQSDYSIYLTDLTSVWSEQMDRKSILRRALNTDASIDPSEDTSQMRLLLSSIKQALNRQSGSSADFSSSDQGQTIKLLLTNTLPKPLADLQWECTLQKNPFSSVTSNVVAPLLASRLHARLENHLLLAQIQQKDSIIAKLVAQMQADGSDFGKIFPGAVAARKSHKSDIRDELGRSVPGFGEFDEGKLQRDVDSKMGGSRSLESLLFLSSPIKIDGYWEPIERSGNSDWWKVSSHIQPDSEKAFPSSTNGLQRDPSKDAEQAEMGSTKNSKSLWQQGSFSITSNSLSKKAENQLTRHIGSDESTTDESDDDLSAVPGTVASQNYGPSPTNKAENFTPNNAKPASEKYLGASTPKSDTTDTLRSSSPVEQPKVPPNPAVKPKSRLGKIGGKKSAPSETQTDQSMSDEAATSTNASINPSKASSAGATERQTADLVSRNRESKVGEEQQEPQRETSQERADRNREKLKRELEKSQAGGKKKRRF